MRLVVGLLGSLLLSTGSFAAIPKKAMDRKLNQYLGEGVVVGGKAGKGFSLLNVRRDISTAMSLERVILDLGDAEGRPLKEAVSYFHASVEKNPPRVVLDLAQLHRSRLDETKLKRIFARSPHVKSVQLTADPEDLSSTMVLYLREPMLVEIFEMPARDKASRIVIDLKQARAQGGPTKSDGSL